MATKNRPVVQVECHLADALGDTSLASFAAEVGLTRQELSSYSRGESQPRVGMAIMLAGRLQMPVEDLWTITVLPGPAKRKARPAAATPPTPTFSLLDGDTE